MWFRFLIWTPLAFRVVPFSGFHLLRSFCWVFIVDRGIPQPKPAAVRGKGGVPGIGIPLRFHQDAIPAGFPFDKHTVPAQVAGVKPHLVVVVEQENLIFHKAAFLELTVLLVGEHNNLFYLKPRLAL